MPRLSAALLVCAGLAGCASTPPPEAPAPDLPEAPALNLREQQERACVAATAAHVGASPDAVNPTWSRETGRGTALVDVRDGRRLHVCEVDASARPLRLEHPRA